MAIESLSQPTLAPVFLQCFSNQIYLGTSINKGFNTYSRKGTWRGGDIEFGIDPWEVGYKGNDILRRDILHITYYFFSKSRHECLKEL